MSILQEYAKIRKDIGEAEFKRIEKFLDENKDLYLSDVYYRPEINEKFQTWKKKKTSVSKGKKPATKPKAKASTTGNEFTKAQNIRVSRGGKIVLESTNKRVNKDGTMKFVTRRTYKKPTKANLDKVKQAGYKVDVK